MSSAELKKAINDEMVRLQSRDELTERRFELLLWTSDNPCDELAKVAVAAWNRVTVEAMPKMWHGHTCQATKDAWERVGVAVATYLAENPQVADAMLAARNNTNENKGE